MLSTPHQLFIGEDEGYSLMYVGPEMRTIKKRKFIILIDRIFDSLAVFDN